MSYRREFMSLRQYAAVIGNSRDEVKIQGFIPTDDVYGDVHNIRIPRGDIVGIYNVLRKFALQNEQYAIAQYQHNAQQSVNMQERSRGKALDEFGFMNIEQGIATPLPKFAADAGQDIGVGEVHRLEVLLLEFGQRDAPSPAAPETRQPLQRKRASSSSVGATDVDKRPRFQWKKKEDRDDAGCFATWSDDRVPPPAIPKPVTGTRTVSVCRPPPTPRAPVPPKENFPKRNVVPDPPIAPKGHPASFVPGMSRMQGPHGSLPRQSSHHCLKLRAMDLQMTAPVKGKPCGSVGRMLMPPKRSNIPKDLLAPPIQHQPPPIQNPPVPRPPSTPPPKVPPVPNPAAPKLPTVGKFHHHRVIHQCQACHQQQGHL